MAHVELCSKLTNTLAILLMVKLQFENAGVCLQSLWDSQNVHFLCIYMGTACSTEDLLSLTDCYKVEAFTALLMARK